MKTFVYIDHFKGEAQPASWEALGLAKSFGPATALVFGSGVDEVVKAALEYGADEVLLADDSARRDQCGEGNQRAALPVVHGHPQGLESNHPCLDIE